MTVLGRVPIFGGSRCDILHALVPFGTRSTDENFMKFCNGQNFNRADSLSIDARRTRIKEIQTSLVQSVLYL